MTVNARFGEHMIEVGPHALHEAGPHAKREAENQFQPLLCKQVFGIGLGVVEYGHGTSERIW